MAEGILILETPPAVEQTNGVTFKLGTYVALFLYEIADPILDAKKLVVAPTPVSTLLQVVSQKTIDRYLEEPELAAFETGTAAWEFVTGQVKAIKDTEEADLREETPAELIDRIGHDWAVAKARALACWRATYVHSGRRLPPTR